MKFLLEYSDLKFLAQVVMSYCVKINQENNCNGPVCASHPYSLAFWDLSIGFYTAKSKSPTQNWTHNLYLQAYL